jgi:hypothetical protein
MALEKGTILVAKNYIKCYVPSFQFEVGTEFVYLFSYQGCYMVQRSHNGKVYDSGNLLPEHRGEGGCLLAVKPCDVEVKKENKNAKNTKTNQSPTHILEVLIKKFKEKYPILKEVKVPNEPITIRDTEGFHASGENGYISRLRINKEGMLEYYHDWWQYGWFDDDKYIPQKIEALKQVL